MKEGLRYNIFILVLLWAIPPFLFAQTSFTKQYILEQTNTTALMALSQQKQLQFAGEQRSVKEYAKVKIKQTQD